MKTFREKTATNFGLPPPAWLLKITRRNGQNGNGVDFKKPSGDSGKLLKAGYTFRYPTLDDALENILFNE